MGTLRHDTGRRVRVGILAVLMALGPGVGAVRAAEVPDLFANAPVDENEDGRGSGDEVVPVSIEQKNGGLELHAKNEDITNVLELLGRLYEVNVVVGQNVKGKVTADFYGVTLEEALDAIARANQLRWAREGNFIYMHTPDEMDAIQKDLTRLETQVYHLNYLTSDEALKVIEPVLSDKATTAATTASAVGIPSGAEDVGGNSLGLNDAIIVCDFPESLERVTDIIKRMDRRPRMVLVEATILQTTLDDETSLGINFNTLAGVDFRDLAAASSPVSDPDVVMGNAAAAGAAQEAPWGQVWTEGFATPGTGLNIGVITNNISFFINALEAVTDTNILSNPKILALNKQRAEVIVGQKLGYVTTEVTETTAIQTVEFLDVGTQLVFRPFISDDGYVRMEVHPEVSSGLVRTVGDLALPEETTTEITCNVMVRDGETIVIGGLFDEDVSIGRSQVPGLANIPGLGWLFRSKDDSTVRREIIILLTPHIIDEEKAYELGDQLRDDIERRCMGLREGFHCFSRETLTVDRMKQADRHWRRYEETGDPQALDDALWHNRLALYMSPNSLQALRLKDRILTEKRGRPMRPKTWTIWDSIGEAMKPWDRTRGLVPKPEVEVVPPSPELMPGQILPPPPPSPVEIVPIPEAGAEEPPEPEPPEPAGEAVETKEAHDEDR